MVSDFGPQKETLRLLALPSGITQPGGPYGTPRIEARSAAKSPFNCALKQGRFLAFCKGGAGLDLGMSALGVALGDCGAGAH